MGRMEVAVVQLLLLAAAVTTGNAAKCYQCTSVTDSKCNDPFDAANMQPSECSLQSIHQLGAKVSNALETLGMNFGVDLPSGGSNPEVHWSCMKVDYTTSSGEKHVMRACHPPKSDSYDPCALKNSNDKKSFCGVCEGDGCNGAGRLGGVSALVYLLLPCLVALKAVGA